MSVLTSWLASPPPDAAIQIAPEAVSVGVLGVRGGEPVVQGYAIEPLPAGAVTAKVASPREDPGGRWRARLIPVEGNGRRFVLVDLESPEGVFVNHKRVVDAVLLRPGDIIQLGAQGAEIELKIEGPLL